MYKTMQAMFPMGKFVCQWHEHDKHYMWQHHCYANKVPQSIIYINNIQYKGITFSVINQLFSSSFSFICPFVQACMHVYVHVCPDEKKPVLQSVHKLSGLLMSFSLQITVDGEYSNDDDSGNDDVTS